MTITREQAAQAVKDHGTQRKAATALGVSLGKLQRRLRGQGEPTTDDPPKFEPRGRLEAKGEATIPWPPKGTVSRYILTSAQNDTAIAEPTWRSIHNLLDYWRRYDHRCHRAELLVSRFAYRNFQSEDKAAWGRGRTPAGKRLVWAPDLAPYLLDARLRLARKLVFCGEMNLSPTARHPMSTLESYNGSLSAVFPHTRVAMRSEPSVGFEGAKLLHTTGAITMRNYIQRKAGLQAEFHHCYGGALVEVDHDGNFWVRQLNATDDGEIYDLDVRATPEGVTTGHRPLAAYLSDLHPEELDQVQLQTAIGMIRDLRPERLFIGDVLSVRLSHHNRGNHLMRHALRHSGDHDLRRGLMACAGALMVLGQEGELYVVRGNHDDHLLRWITEEPGYADPTNARLWHQLNLALMDHIELNEGREDWDKTCNPVALALQTLALNSLKVERWLHLDEVVNIAGINHGAHGHAGPGGRPGGPEKFAKLGMKSNFGHVHAPGIYDGAYFAGTFGRHLYYKGPTGSTCANILTYPNGKRQIVVNWRGRWRA